VIQRSASSPTIQGKNCHSHCEISRSVPEAAFAILLTSAPA
jgi:hypothetical protein